MPPRVWWLCFLSMAAAYFPGAIQVGFSELRAIIFFVANCSEVLIAEVALRRLIQGQLKFTILRDVVIFIMFAVLIAPAISASIASIATFNESVVVYRGAWHVWFIADALGHLILTPVILTWIMVGLALY